MAAVAIWPLPYHLFGRYKTRHSMIREVFTAALLTVATGFIAGCVLSPLASDFEETPTQSLLALGLNDSRHIINLVAVLLGSVVSGSLVGLVGVEGATDNLCLGAAALLLPPGCNAGLCLAFAALGSVDHSKMVVAGCTSLALFLVAILTTKASSVIACKLQSSCRRMESSSPLPPVGESSPVRPVTNRNVPSRGSNSMDIGECIGRVGSTPRAKHRPWVHAHSDRREGPGSIMTTVGVDTLGKEMESMMQML
jgi:hypothetical protein